MDGRVKPGHDEARGIATSSPVTRGLDPRVHLLGKKHSAKAMDCRVGPGNDGGWVSVN